MIIENYFVFVIRKKLFKFKSFISLRLFILIFESNLKLLTLNFLFKLNENSLFELRFISFNFNLGKKDFMKLSIFFSSKVMSSFSSDPSM